MAKHSDSHVNHQCIPLIKNKTFLSRAVVNIINNKIAFACLAFIFVISIFSFVAPLICRYDYLTTNFQTINTPPNKEHWFGTDILGRDLWARVWRGTQVSLFIGLLGSIIPQFIGVVIGCVAGYSGGMVDHILTGFIEVCICVPSLVYITLISLFLGASTGTMIFAIAISSWMETALFVRGRVIQFKSRDFVVAAKIQGASSIKIITKHIIPNIAGSIIISVFSAVPKAIFTETYLSFIGLGASSTVSLGQLCKSGTSVCRLYPYQLIIPGGIISALILVFYMLGNCLNDALDMRLKNR